MGQINFFKKKKLFNKFFVFILFCLIVFNNKNLLANQKYNSKNTVIVFDLNQVLFRKDFSQIAKKCIEGLAKEGLWKYAISPFFWINLSKFNNKNNSKEKIFLDLLGKYPELKKKEDFYISLTTSHKIIELSYKLAKDLNLAGYRLYILSNLGIISFKGMLKKFPDVFKLFSGYYVPSPDNNYNSKPNRSFYESFVRYLDNVGEQNKNIIFIDDKTENLIAAKKLGFITIKCNSIKEVRSSLTKLNII